VSQRNRLKRASAKLGEFRDYQRIRIFQAVPTHRKSVIAYWWPSVTATFVLPHIY